MKKQFYFSFLLTLLALNTWGQNKLTGRVTDSNGALPGVSVLVKGTNVGSTTDADGKFSITNVPTAATIVVSYIGYLSQEINV